MNNIKFIFNSPLFYLLLIPGIFLSLLPYFKLNKQNRKTPNRIISMVIHIIIIFLLTTILAGYKISMSKYDIKNEIYLLVDHSSSTKQSKEVIDSKVYEIINELDDNYKLGIISFNKNAEIISSLSTNKDLLLSKYNNYKVNEAGVDGTNIENALNLAKEELKENGGRIILITDGRETDGVVLKSASDLKSLNIKLDAIYINHQISQSEVQINSVELPSHIETDSEISILVSVSSMSQVLATIKIYDNGNLIDSEEGVSVLLNGGTDVFAFDYTFYKTGLHEIKVVVESVGDEVIENNVFYQVADVDGTSNRILIIEGSASESDKLLNVIQNDFVIDVIRITDDFDNDIIRKYDGLIMMNISNSDLPNGFDIALKNYVETQGGSLLTVGGDNSYKEEDMKGSVFESILPVFSSTESKSMAVILVIDKSGSMVTHNSAKLELAKQGAIDSVNALKDNDYVGIVIFDANPVVLVEPTPVSNKAEIITKIESIEAGYGTMYTGGLREAKRLLDNFEGNQNFNKHVIFLTDGAPQDTGYEAVINNYGSISLTTIAIGDDHGINYAIVEGMVRVVDERGQYYQVLNEYELPTIMRDEALSVASSYVNEETFVPHVYTRIESVANVFGLPSLNGFYGTRLKENATLVLEHNSNPIYAEWNFGKGVVGSFMSDLNGNYSNEYFYDIRGINLISNIIKGMMPEDFINTYDTNVKYKINNFERVAEVTSFLEDGEYIKATIENPSGLKSELLFNDQTTNIKTTSFETVQQGIYIMEITKYDSLGKIISTHQSYSTFSYSKEYDTFYNDYEAFDEVKEIVKIGDGSIIFDVENIFIKELQTKVVTKNPTIILLIISIVLYLLDIVMRKFKLTKLFKEKKK